MHTSVWIYSLETLQSPSCQENLDFLSASFTWTGAIFLGRSVSLPIIPFSKKNQREATCICLTSYRSLRAHQKKLILMFIYIWKHLMTRRKPACTIFLDCMKKPEYFIFCGLRSSKGTIHCILSKTKINYLFWVMWK